jgi:hypothetical protein
MIISHLLFPKVLHPPSIFRTISLQYVLLSNESMLALSNHDYISAFWYQNKCHIIIIICKQDCITKIEILSHLKSPYTISHFVFATCAILWQRWVSTWVYPMQSSSIWMWQTQIGHASLPYPNLWWILLSFPSPNSSVYHFMWEPSPFENQWSLQSW